MSIDNPIIIIGAGQAGAQAAFSLRQSGYDGPVILIGAEDVYPYQRPPLSKAYLKGELEEQRLYLRPKEFFEKQGIELMLGRKVETIDKEGKAIFLSGGEKLSYSKLLLATGAPPRQITIPGNNLSGVHYLRTLHDSQALSHILTSEKPVVIVGAGYIGLEVAAVARSAGKKVVVVELADRVLARVASDPVSRFYEDLHQRHGVEFRFGAGAEAFVGNQSIELVKLTSGEAISCGNVLVGIGALPLTGIAEDAGLEVNNGIVVDENARTSDPNIWAAGDCSNFPSERYGRRLRLESVPNAIDQAKVAAANMAGGDVVYNSLPWFWSDQYDVKLQAVGLFDGFDKEVVRGKPDTGSFSVWYFENGKLIAVNAINDPAAFAISKKILTDGTQIDPKDVADPSIDLKQIALG